MTTAVQPVRLLIFQVGKFTTLQKLQLCKPKQDISQ